MIGLFLATAGSGAQPLQINLGSLEVDETAGAGLLVGTLSVSGDQGGGWVYSLLDDVGGMFAVSGASLTVGTTPLNRKTFPAPTIQIRATRGLQTIDRTATLAVRRPLPPLPLPGGAKVAALGDSYVQRSGYARVAGTTLQGLGLYARGALNFVGTLDGRFRIETFVNEAKPYATLAGGDMLDGAYQGLGGDRIDFAYAARPGFVGRVDYALEREPDILLIDSCGVNNINDGDGADKIILLLDALMTRIRRAGVWAVATTLPELLNASAAQKDEIAKVNAWLVAQKDNGRPGFRLADTRPIEGPGAASSTILLDGIHRGPYGAYRVGKDVLLPLLRTMVTAADRFDRNPLSANVFPFPGIPGNGGTKTVASGAATDVSGNVATGMNVHRTTGTSLVACSKETIAVGDEKQVFTITPVDDGIAQHILRFRVAASLNTALSAMGIDPATDWGLEMLLPVELNDWEGWDTNSANGGGPATFNVYGYNGSTFTWQAGNSASYRDGSFLLNALFQFYPGRTPTSLRLGATSGEPFSLIWKSNVSGTGIAKFGSPIFRRITQNPKTAWKL